jgi:hypothetical protein
LVGSSTKSLFRVGEKSLHCVSRLSKAVMNAVGAETAAGSERHGTAVNAEISRTVNVKPFRRMAAARSVGWRSAISAGAGILGMAVLAAGAISAPGSVSR